jgi:antitoxin ParD1/3/4
MTLELPVDLQQFVREAVGAGAFRTETDVVAEGLRLLRERQRHVAELRREILPAVERLKRGEGITLDDDGLDAFFEDIIARGEARLQTEQSNP